MYAILFALSCLFSPFCNLFALAAISSNGSHGVRTLYQFPKDTWVENIAVRPTGQFLITLLDPTPDLYQIDPFISQAPILVCRFPDALGALGIAEIEPDVFAVITGNSTIQIVPGSFSVWKVDMRTFNASNGSPATISKITDIPEAQLLNGAALLNQGSGIVLLAESIGGFAWGLNTRTGEYAKVLENPLTKGGAGPVPGINGIHVRDSFVYFTNSAQRLLARVPVHLTNGTAAGPYEVVAQLNASFVDDFALASRDIAYVATNFDNTIVKVRTAGKDAGTSSIVEGNIHSTAFAGTTSAAFGRTASDCKVLYVTTTGGLGAPVNGSIVEGGKVLAVDTAMLH